MAKFKLQRRKGVTRGAYKLYWDLVTNLRAITLKKCMIHSSTKYVVINEKYHEQYIYQPLTLPFKLCIIYSN